MIKIGETIGVLLEFNSLTGLGQLTYFRNG